MTSTFAVALLAEGVDRNKSLLVTMIVSHVALLAEGVDRNTASKTSLQGLLVALLAEGVDRNVVGVDSCNLARGSPSSRRAWIEISWLAHLAVLRHKSPSSRRAWIEILRTSTCFHSVAVALLAEGVDRNTPLCCSFATLACRPPRGGRG